MAKFIINKPSWTDQNGVVRQNGEVVEMPDEVAEFYGFQSTDAQKTGDVKEGGRNSQEQARAKSVGGTTEPTSGSQEGATSGGHSPKSSGQQSSRSASESKGGR